MNLHPQSLGMPLNGQPNTIMTLVSNSGKSSWSFPESAKSVQPALPVATGTTTTSSGSSQQGGGESDNVENAEFGAYKFLIS